MTKMEYMALVAKHSVFFGNEGHTATSSAHICDLAKEHTRKLTSEIENAQFYHTEIGIIGTSEFTQVEKGLSSTDFVLKNVEKIGQMNALIAWLREAIKAKEELGNAVSKISIPYPDRPERPEKPKYMTEDDYLATLSVKERNDIFKWNAIAAMYGKLVRPGGMIANQREQLLKKAASSYETDYAGSNTIIKRYTPSVEPQDVEKMYFDAQNLYRSAQAACNSYKNKCEEALNKNKAEIDVAYSEALGNFDQEMEKYDQEVAQLRNDFSMWALKEHENIRNLKIIIPKDLIPAYEEVKNL